MAPLGRFAVKRSLNGRIREARTAGSGREPPVRRWSQIDVSRRRTNAIHVPVQLEYEKTCIAPPIDRRGWMRASDDTRRVTAMPWTPSAPAPNLARGRPGAAARGGHTALRRGTPGPNLGPPRANPPRPPRRTASSCGRGARHGTASTPRRCSRTQNPCGYWLSVESTSTSSAQSRRGAES